MSAVFDSVAHGEPTLITLGCMSHQDAVRIVAACWCPNVPSFHLQRSLSVLVASKQTLQLQRTNPVTSGLAPIQCLVPAW